jgi:L-glutamine-phosphate cytidylyltransferase
MSNHNRIRTAVILAAGMGSRLRPYTDTCPKCLVEVAGKPILGHMIEALEENGFQKLIVVTGCKADQVETFLKTWPTSLTIETIHNEVYATTNNIYSLWLAHSRIDSGFALIESDIVLDSKILSEFSYENRIALEAYDPERHHGTTAEVCEHGYLNKLHVRRDPPDADDLFKTVNIYSFCKGTSGHIFDAIGDLVTQGQTDIFYELAIRDLLEQDQISLRMVDFSDVWWDEIDTPEDLIRAEQLGEHFLMQSSLNG